MNRYPCAAVLLALSLAAGCAGRVGFGEKGRVDEQLIQERRLCMTRPPVEVEACLQRAQQDYLVREGMRRRAASGGAPVEEGPTAGGTGRTAEGDQAAPE
jgi:hypothetical protein